MKKYLEKKYFFLIDFFFQIEKNAKKKKCSEKS